jgi:hypothetical protein
MNHPILSSSLALIIVGLFTANAAAAELRPAVAPQCYDQLLSATPKLEWPAKAAALISAAPPHRREAAALAVVGAVSRMNAAALPPVVATIVKAEPGLGRTVVAEAAKLQPRLSMQIHQAAAPVADVTTAGVVAAPPLSHAPAAAPSESGVIQKMGAPHSVPGPPYRKGHYKTSWWPPNPKR